MAASSDGSGETEAKPPATEEAAEEPKPEEKKPAPPPAAPPAAPKAPEPTPQPPTAAPPRPAAPAVAPRPVAAAPGAAAARPAPAARPPPRPPPPPVAQKPPPREEKNLIFRFIDYVIDHLERTVFFGMKFTQPKKFVSPLAFLGVLTFMVFITLGITGAVLLIYYIPSLEQAYDTVKLINCGGLPPTVRECAELIEKGIQPPPYGFLIRNIHYHASNAMVFLALFHLYYQYFSGKFKIRNDVIWATGVLLGTMTWLEAFTGYDLILNTRAVAAINIAVGLNNAAPVIGPLIVATIFGSGYLDFSLRFYALHVFIVPMLMVILMFFHFPRYMVFDTPMVAIISGAIIMVGGLFPVEVGIKFDPRLPPGITVPEWYVTGLFAFIRTGLDRFMMGAVLPTIFILMFFVIPWVDNTKKFRWQDRPFFTALAMASIAQIILSTYWGFYVNTPLEQQGLVAQALAIPPLQFWGLMFSLAIISYALTYTTVRLLKGYEAKRHVPRAAPGIDYIIPAKWVVAILGGLLLFQILLNLLAYQAYVAGFPNLALFEIGLALVVFGLVFHMYRYSRLYL